MSEEAVRIHQPAAEVSREALARAEEMIEREEGAHNKLAGRLAALVAVTAIAMSIFHLYTAYAIVRPEHLRAIHVAFVLFLTFLVFPVSRRFRHRVMWWDWLLAAGGVATAVYLIAGGDDFFDRSILPNDWDIAFGVLLVVLILEAMRRTTGWILPVITASFLAYAFFGPYLPAPWTHKGYEIPRLVGHMYMTLEGVYGTAINVSSTLIILFTIYGAFLQFSGAGKFFIDFSFSAMGGKPTGAGRTVTLASFLLGGPSGSGVATTVTLGAVAAPMLAKVGYSKEEAGGLLAAGGLGAIISPPVLGAAAFIIAEFLKISYLDVVLMAVIPTCLFYLTLFLMVEIDVRKFGMKNVTFEQVESAWSLAKKYWYHFLSLTSIIAFMLMGFSPELSVFWATVVAFATSFLRRDTALVTFEKKPFWKNLTDSGFSKALQGGSMSVLNVAATCAGAGLIVGVVTLTGLGLKFSSIVLAYAGNSLLLTAIYTALIVWIVGLAVPVTASYIICAVIAAPALIALKVPEYAAHMFIFYYAVLSEVSPPTALSPFAAAAITGGDPYKTTLQCWKYTTPAFLVPFMFVLDPSGTGLLLTGSLKTLASANWWSIALVTTTAAVGIMALCGAFQGWLFRKTTVYERWMLFIAGVLLVYPKTLFDIIGFGLVAVVLALQWFHKPCDTDILILGAGGAGLFAALHAHKANPALSITVAVKGLLGKCGCTRMVQGGYNVALAKEDSIERHFMDTIEGGKWLPDQELAWKLVVLAVERVRELENELGCFFDRNPDGTIHQKAFAGQTFDRTVHKGDLTGIEIMNRLAEQVWARNIHRLEEYRAVELIGSQQGISGVLFIDMRTGEYVFVRAKAVLLATGGGPTMYKYHTPSGDKSCDGLAMALRAGLPLRDMEMVQFHPTGLLAGTHTRMTGTVLEEGLRGAGGYLLNGAKERFMPGYDPMAERATRDFVSRAMFLELQKKPSPHGGLYISMAHLGPEKVAREFKGMVERCADCGFDLAGGLVEVVPTAHYMMGGVEFAADCSTAMPGLFVAGEDSGGVHGANRLGGNGVANSTVFGAVAGETMAAWVRDQKLREPGSGAIDAAIAACERPFTRGKSLDLEALREKLYETMWQKVGIVRDDASLESALEDLRGIEAELASGALPDLQRAFNLTWHDWLNLVSLTEVSKVIAQAALARRNSRGAHYRSDFPDAGSLEQSAFSSYRDGTISMKPVAFTRVRPGQSLLKNAA